LTFPSESIIANHNVDNIVVGDRGVDPFANFKTFLPEASLTEKVVGYLEKLIIEGTFKPRERLIEEDLARALGVSRPPIREALRALEREALVTFSPRRGVAVTEITEKDIQDVYLIRATLESLAVKLAAKNVSVEELEKIEGIYKQMVQAAKKKDLSLYFQLNQEFHGSVFSASKNEKLTKILDNLGKQTLRFRYYTLSTPGRLEGSIDNHRRLVDALKSRDSRLAGRLRTKQILDGGKILKEHLGNQFRIP
jgi:DNA-binding GntR family transcriptional regulator